MGSGQPDLRYVCAYSRPRALRRLRLAACHGQGSLRHVPHVRYMFTKRRGRDKTPDEIQRGWERAVDNAFELRYWR